MGRRPLVLERVRCTGQPRCGGVGGHLRGLLCPTAPVVAMAAGSAMKSLLYVPAASHVCIYYYPASEGLCSHNQRNIELNFQVT